MPSVTVTSGAPDIADGVYPVVLSEITGDPKDPENPKVVTAQRGERAGQEVELWDWHFLFTTVRDPKSGEAVELVESTSTASGPRSKMYAWLTAFRNGVPPQIGERIEFSDLYARQALATVQKDQSGWPRIVNLGAMPVGMQSQQLAQVTGAPVQQPGAPAPAAAAPQPLRQTVAAGSVPLTDAAAAQADDLPF